MSYKKFIIGLWSSQKDGEFGFSVEFGFYCFDFQIYNIRNISENKYHKKCLKALEIA